VHAALVIIYRISLARRTTKKHIKFASFQPRCFKKAGGRYILNWGENEFGIWMGIFIGFSGGTLDIVASKNCIPSLAESLG